MNRYVVQDLKGYGDDFMLLKIRVFFAYFWITEIKRMDDSTTRVLGFFQEFRLYALGSAELNWGLKIACRENNLELTLLMIRLGATNFNSGFSMIVRNIRVTRNINNPNPDLVYLLFKKGITRFYQGIYIACFLNHRDLVDLIIKKKRARANIFQDWDDTFLNYGLQGACYGGHQNLVDLMIDLGADDWDLGLSGACQGRHRELIESMFRYGAKQCGHCGKTFLGHFKK